MRLSRKAAVAAEWSGAAELALAASLAALLLWTVLAAWRGGPEISPSLHYAGAPLVLGAGVVAGRLSARRALEPLGAAMAAVFVGVVLVVFPFYRNAEAAAGIQLVAVSGLLLTRVVHASPRARTVAWQALLAGVVGVLGVLLAARAQAASLLVIGLVVLTALALRRGAAPSRRVLRGFSLGSVAVAALAVLVLGASSTWPQWLSRPGSLSGARHRLWGDALALWGEHPLLGGGPGSFYEYSGTARSEEHLYAAHSSILQVGAELGTIGVLLFLAVLVSGALVASRGDRARALIGVAAWCALAVHSMIDHLYEFPVVVLLAGLVIGWSGARRGTVPELRGGVLDASRHDPA